jgi:hypothetical protein
VDPASRFSLQIWNLGVLTVPAAVAAATAMEPATASMESTTSTAVETTASVEPAFAAAEPAPAVESTIAAPEAAAIKSAAVEASASVKPASPMIETTPPVETAAVVTASIVTGTVETVEPRAGAYKDAPRKVVWPVVTVRRAFIRVIPIVAVGAHRSRTVVARADSNANRNLRMRRSCRRQCENRQ